MNDLEKIKFMWGCTSCGNSYNPCYTSFYSLKEEYLVATWCPYGTKTKPRWTKIEEEDS